MTIDRTQMLGIAHAERERLGRTIQYTPPAVWDAESVCAGWRNRDIVAHLAAQDTAAAQLLRASRPQSSTRSARPTTATCG